MIYEIKEDPILQVPSQELPTSSKSNLEDGGVLDTLIFMVECQNLAHMMIITYQDDL